MKDNSRFVLTNRPAEVRLSPSEARIAEALTQLQEGFGVQLAQALNFEVQLATIYVLLERMEKKGVLTSRVEETRNKDGRRVTRRMYRIAPHAVAKEGDVHASRKTTKESPPNFAGTGLVPS